MTETIQEPKPLGFRLLCADALSDNENKVFGKILL